MSYNPAEGFPRVMPSLVYEEVATAIEFLSRAFGLQEHLRWVDSDDRVQHAEMRLNHAFIELAGSKEGYAPPRQTGVLSQHLVVMVDDVDRHYETAAAAGATIIDSPEDKPWGLRQYMAADPEGHRWEFSQFLRDVPPAEWGARLAE